MSWIACLCQPLYCHYEEKARVIGDKRKPRKRLAFVGLPFLATAFFIMFSGTPTDERHGEQVEVMDA